MKARTMSDRVHEYLDYRRALGYQIRINGQLLVSFARYADSSGHEGPLTTELALRWARLPEQATRLYQARRLEIVGTLARYLAAREPGTEIPLRGLLGPAHARRPAFLYSAADLTALIQAARMLTPIDGLRPHTYVALLGLLACTGLRIAEALALQISDFDWHRQLLTVRHTKFHKSRLVPLHPSALGPLRDYAAARNQRQTPRPDTPFFLSDKGRPLPYGTVRSTFHRLLRQALPGVAPVGRVRPRLHDIRHSFACSRLLDWYRTGTDIDRAIDQLSVYLGHAKVTDTYWYLTGVPELLDLVAQRFEQFTLPLHGEPS
jgi:integrase